MDEYIIDCRGEEWTSKDIAHEMGVPAEALQGRWYDLQQQQKVPGEVFATRRKKGEVEWSEKEDEIVLQA